MNSSINNISRFVPRGFRVTSAHLLVGLLILTLSLRSLHSPIFYATANRDSGVFLYMGQQITAGAIPYRDVWDHKMPAIFYVNALGYLIDNSGRWGIWFIETITLLVATAISYHLFTNIYTKRVSILANTCWIIPINSLVGSGNFVESYGLLIQFLVLYFTVSYFRVHNSLHLFVIGALTALLFLFRQNLIGLSATLSITLIIINGMKNWRTTLLQGLMLFAGFILVIGVVAVYFLINNALDQLWSAAFSYNFLYSSATISQRLTTGIEALALTTRAGLAALAIGGWLICVFNSSTSKQLRMRLFVIIGLPIEFLMVSISGLAYEHYYITLLPILSFCAAIIIDQALHFSSVNLPRRFLVVFLTIAAIPTISEELRTAGIKVIRGTENNRIETLVHYVQEQSLEHLLVWGADPYLNFITGTTSQTRFVYQYPLVMSGYVNETMISEFLNDIEEGGIDYLLDVSSETGGFNSVPSIDPVLRIPWYRNTDSSIVDLWEPVFDYLSTNFELMNEIDLGNWRLYVRNSE